MNGYLITFYTEMNQRYKNMPIHDWLLEQARQLGLKGATVIQGSEGIDHTGRLHSAHFVELVDQPVQVQFALSEADSEQFFTHLNQEDVRIFYVKTPVQFGTVGNLKGKE